MNKNEFLKKLKESLEESFEADFINEQIDYYDKYISEEIKKGKSENEVISELGDSRLIAKTIKTVNKVEIVEHDTTNEKDYKSNTTDSKYSYYGNNSNQNNRVRDVNIIGCAIAFLVAFIIIMGMMRFFGNVAIGLGSLAFSGPLGFLFVLLLFYLIFGRGRL